MLINIEEIVRKANVIVDTFETRDPNELVKCLNLPVVTQDLKNYLGYFCVYRDVPMIILNENLDDDLRNVVLLHEIGHYVLHSELKDEVGNLVFGENMFFSDVLNQREYEANYFAAEVAIPDDEFFEFASYGYTFEQMARALRTNENLLALKVKILKNQGYDLNLQPYESNFLNR